MESPYFVTCALHQRTTILLKKINAKIQAAKRAAHSKVYSHNSSSKHSLVFM